MERGLESCNSVVELEYLVSLRPCVWLSLLQPQSLLCAWMLQNANGATCGCFWKLIRDFFFLMYSRFTATKHRLNRFPGTRLSLLPQIQLMLPPELGAARCSPQPVSWPSLSLSYISTVRDSGQETSLLPHLDPPRMSTTSPVWLGRERSTSNRLLLYLNRKHWES